MLDGIKMSIRVTIKKEQEIYNNQWNYVNSFNNLHD